MAESQTPEETLDPAVLTAEPVREVPRIEALRARVAELQKRVSDLKIEIVPPSEKDSQKGYVLAKWGRTRVAQVVEGKGTIDDAECAVLEVAIAHLTVS